MTGMPKTRNAKWREGFRTPSDVDADRLLKEVLSLDSGNGFEAEDLRKYATKNRKSEIAKCLEWDKDKAFKEYQLEQCRYICRSIEYEIVITGGNVYESTKVFEHVEGKYRQTIDIMSNKDWREKLVERVFNELESLKSRYSHLTELKIVFETIEAERSKFNASKKKKATKKTSSRRKSGV